MPARLLPTRASQALGAPGAERKEEAGAECPVPQGSTLITLSPLLTPSGHSPLATVAVSNGVHVPPSQTSRRPEAGPLPAPLSPPSALPLRCVCQSVDDEP